jgi:hypothetical protein
MPLAAITGGDRQGLFGGAAGIFVAPPKANASAAGLAIARLEKRRYFPC